MKRAIFLAAALLVMPALGSAKKPPEMTGLELQQLQSKDFEAPKEVVFSSVMSVLQDAGYRIGNANKDTGLITGTASTTGKMMYSLWTGFGRKKKTPIVSAYIESRGVSAARVRLNFVMAKVKSTIYGSGAQDEEPILDPATYQQAFEKISQAVFVRQATDAVPAPASPAALARPATIVTPAASTVSSDSPR